MFALTMYVCIVYVTKLRTLMVSILDNLHAYTR